MAGFGRWAIHGVFALTVSSSAHAALSDQLHAIREKILGLEQTLVENGKDQQKGQESARKAKALIQLQKKERQLGKVRLSELEKTIQELERRRSDLSTKVKGTQQSVRRSLGLLERAARDAPRYPEHEKLNVPRRQVLSRLANRGLTEIEALKVDLQDADQLEARIVEEKNHLAYLAQDLQEQEGILELNRKIQSEMVHQRRQERLEQLQSYRRLKSAESEIEKLLAQFNSRMELQQLNEAERQASKSMMWGDFNRSRGKLSPPLQNGKILTGFGRAFDPKSQLYVFKKGVDIEGPKLSPVRAVAPGRVAYSGSLADYGKVVIVDHGNHFYSLYAHLGELNRKTGDPLLEKDAIGKTDDSGNPLYFEIRQRNVAVNPLQWLFN